MNEKACRGPCGQTKPIDEFHKHPQMADGHLNVCKVCHNEAAKQRRLKMEQDPAWVERERDRLSAWRAAHPEAWKASRGRAQQKTKETGLTARTVATRRERKKGGSVGPVALRQVLERDGMVCGICRREIADKRQLHFDHVVPLARGGAHTKENLQPTHHRCNSWKGDRLPEELVGLTPPEPGEVDEWEERRREAGRARQAEAMRAMFAAMTPEERAAHGAKISAAKKGKKHPPGSLTGGSRGPATPEAIAKRSEANRAKWAAKTPEELEAWRARCRSVKAGSPGNAANLAKGHTPEVRAKAIAASAELRRGVALPEEQKKAIAEGLARAYASGMRKAGHSEETKAKISATKKRKAFWKASRDWLMRPRAGEAAAPSSAPTA